MALAAAAIHGEFTKTGGLPIAAQPIAVTTGDTLTVELRLPRYNPPKIGFELQVWTDPKPVYDGMVRITTSSLDPSIVTVKVKGWRKGLVRLVASTTTQKIAELDLRISGEPTMEMTLSDALQNNKIQAGPDTLLLRSGIEMDRIWGVTQ